MRCCLRGGLSAGFNGDAFWSHDIGGFVGPQPSPEMYIRWMQFGMLSPFCRWHGTTPREPWEYGETALEVARHYGELRYRLIPYLRQCAEETCERGTPILRHLKLEFPEDALLEHVDDQYMLGPDLLVAPVLEPGVSQRRVIFPSGHWRPFEGGEAVEGPCARNVEAPLERIPLFVRVGATIPMFETAPQHLKGELPNVKAVRFD